MKAPHVWDRCLRRRVDQSRVCGAVSGITARRRSARSVRANVFSDVPSRERGFLPIDDPTTRLLVPGAEAWEAAVDALPKLAVASGAGRLRAELERLPPFPLAAVLPPPAADAGAAGADVGAAGAPSSTGAGEWHELELEQRPAVAWPCPPRLWRAYSVLSFLAHAYVWCDGGGGGGGGGGTSGSGDDSSGGGGLNGAWSPPARLPAVIAVPWVAVARALGMPPVLVYSTYNLTNWRRLDAGGPIALGNIVCLNNFLGGVDEEWFRLVHVAIEAAAGPALAALEPLQAAARAGDAGAATERLAEIGGALERMQRLLARMPEKCDPRIYYERVRLPMSGWRGNARLPAGLVYEGVAGGRPLRLYGETGAQSSVVAALDAALGVEHGEGWMREYLGAMAAHMPPPHRAYVRRIEAANAAAAAAAAAAGSAGMTPRGFAAAGPRALRAEYDAALAALEAFRGQHKAFAAAYIARFSAKEKGTGGSDFMPALSEYARATKAHRLGG